MTRRVLRVLVEVEGSTFDPDVSNPYAESQAELEAVLTSNLQTITSMDAGDVVTLRDTNGNRCGKVEMEDFPGDSPLLPHWTKLSDLALDVEEEFPVAAFVKSATPREAIAQAQARPERKSVQYSAEPPQKPDETFDKEAARAFDEGEFKEPPRLSSHEHIAGSTDQDAPVRPRRGGGSSPNANVPPPPGDPGMR